MTQMSKSLSIVMYVLMYALAACGGTQESVASPPVGDDHAGGSASDDLDVDRSAGPDGEQSGEGGTDPATAAQEAPAVTFKLTNSAKDDLVFSLDKGWQPVIFAFSGKPPNAKPILMFPKFCTASCDADAAGICPYCPQPDKVKDIKASEKREVVATGALLEVPWDGQIHVYEKARGKREGKKTKCECFRTEPVPAETYTVRACGLRITKSAKKSTKYQCVEGTMTFPAEGPQVVELDFPAP